MRSRLAILLLLAATGASRLPATSAQEPRATGPATDRAIQLSLETDLPDEVVASVVNPLRLPAERTAAFYRDAFGGVLVRLRQPDSAAAFVEWLGGFHADAVAREHLDIEQLRQDAARLARVRLRRTAPARDGRREPFVISRDMLAHPEFYAGRPFTVWGHVRRVTPLIDDDVGRPVLYELRIAPAEEPDRPLLAVVPTLPDGFPLDGEIRAAVTITGYLFRAVAEGESGNGRAFTPLVVAPALFWHQAELTPRVRQALVASVQHRTPHRPEEVDDFYRVLRHAQLVDYDEQQSAARRFLRERIEHLPRDSQADLEHRLLEIAAARRANPRDRHELERREAEARSIHRHELRQAAEARSQPDAFPLFAHLFRSAASAHPHRYTGRPVTFRGHVRKHVSYPADPENESGIPWLHEVWLYPEDGDSNPVVVMSASAPGDLPLGESLLEPASVTGYFHKLWAYPARDTNRVAPMLLAQRVEWLPRPEAAGWSWGALVAFWCVLAVVGTAILWSLWRLTRRRHAPGVYGRLAQDEPPDLSQFS